jgi:exodeoxyribonuclease V alpha subunit
MNMEITLDPRQQDAVAMCLDATKRIVAVTGAAGTGKTTIIRSVARRLQRERKTFVLCAPTGKAARRITQATGLEAVTVHRLLEYPRPGERDPETGKPLATSEPKRDHKTPLEYDVVIADEYMMVGQELDRNLVDALGRGRLLVFGDVNQLAPIEPNKREDDAVLAPFQRHLARNSATLEHVFRQEEGSGILEAANTIRKGMLPRQYDDFKIAFSSSPVKSIIGYCTNARAAGVSFGDVHNQIIVSSKKTWVGTAALNVALRRFYNPDPDFELELPRYKWDEANRLRVAVGDKVVCTENTYDMRDYEQRYGEFNDKGVPVISTFREVPPQCYMLNGDTGIVLDIHDDGSLDIDMGDRIVQVPASYAEYNWSKDTVFDIDPRKRIDLAYALTTHKCQGSEYDRVVYIMNKSVSFMICKENFYTAVTRARKSVLVITDQPSLGRAVKAQAKRK